MNNFGDVLCFTVLIVALVLVGSLARKSHQSVKFPELLALRMIMTPTSSRWGPSFRKLVIRSQISSHKTVWLSLAGLVHCVVSGDIELRHPSRDLPDLLHSGVFVNGWDFRLYVHFTDRIHAVLWSVLARFDVSCTQVLCSSS
jgi:hypothetical protein